MARPSRGHRRSLVDISKPEANRVTFGELEKTTKEIQDKWNAHKWGGVRIAVDEGPPLGLLSIIVRVGSPPTDFSVHESLVCSRSPFFANAMNGAWAEAESRVVPLPDDAPSTFALYRTWLYTGLLACKSSSDSDEWELLACAYVLGEKLQDSDFKDTVIDAMVEKFNKHHPTTAKPRVAPAPTPGPYRIGQVPPPPPSSEPTSATTASEGSSAAETIDAEALELEEMEFFKRNPAVLIYIYENTPPSAPVRRLLVDHYRAAGKPDWISAEKRELLPDDFLYALSFQFMTLKVREEEGQRRPASAPYQWEDGTCSYHEHGGKMCYKRRKHPWVALKDAPEEDRDPQNMGWLVTKHLGWKVEKEGVDGFV
ncbi:uncharacterized protein BDZ99DRAFT_528162 [Mytilinidion resinicola]|uniref:BTB domain-containing protein n=1 Tax=Mytilinidion resinicola TaxID=574789 RepID=A0A6A6XYR2_9PEZI|nr:uncharacterized protein BDZ99DRAFT_528162 [Mytilinidion resinicola]KAF2801691.1 hypothetical protein BDZ99DRAFT_528162 [Mytilinidion resinicola]